MQCPAVPACPQLFLVLLPRPWVSVQQPKPLQTGEVRLGLRKGPSITSLALPCGGVQIVPEKEKFGQENARDVLEGVVSPCTWLTSCPNAWKSSWVL